MFLSSPAKLERTNHSEPRINSAWKVETRRLPAKICRRVFRDCTPLAEKLWKTATSATNLLWISCDYLVSNLWAAL
jgi:hypothetical protein